MTQRNPMNERYQSEDRKGATRKSAASAKPVSKAASSVRIESTKKTPQQKKAERKQQRAKDAERDRQLAALIGSTAEVLLETRNADGLLEGYTPTYVPVYCHTTAQPGDSITCRLTAFHDGACTGEQLA